MRKLTYLSVCSGIEAVSVAWDEKPFDAIAFSEIEDFPSALLQHHFPSIPNLGNMLNINGQAYKGKVDILVGGTPCQAFSIAGQKKSLQDDRGNLTLKFAELADAIEPSFLVWENVPGVLGTKDNAFGQFLGKLSGAAHEIPLPKNRWGNAGYVLGIKRNIAWRTLDSQYFGVPQRRKRVFLVACPQKGYDPREVLFERKSVSRHFESFYQKEKTTASAFKRSPRKANRNATKINSLSHWEGGNIHPALSISSGHGCPGMSNQDVFGQKGACLVPVTCIQGNMIRPNSGCNGKGWNTDNISYTLTSADRHAVFYDNQPSRAEIQETEICPTIRARYGTGGGQTPLVMYENYSLNADVKEVDITPPLRASNDGSLPLIVNNCVIRRITPLECERLQGFPDNYTQIPYRGKPKEQCPDSPRYKAIGNSMTVNVMAWLGERILKVIEDDVSTYRNPLWDRG